MEITIYFKYTLYQFSLISLIIIIIIENIDIEILFLLYSIIT